MNDFYIAIKKSASGYKKMILEAQAQLTEKEFFLRPDTDKNSVAILVHHLAGNLISRWTDFLITDGEKPDRDREKEFADWNGTRDELLAYFEKGWGCLTEAINECEKLNPATSIKIRGEDHTLPDALLRSVLHIAYHAGQITYISRTVHSGEWNWLTIAPGKSEEHNQNPG